MVETIVPAVATTALITWILASYIPVGKEKYFSCLNGIYGSKVFPFRPADAVVLFNSVLSANHSQYMITAGEANICYKIFSAFREDISRIYFDGSAPILDARQEKWLFKHRKRIKKQFTEKRRAVFYLLTEEWLYKQANSHYIKGEPLQDYYKLTELGVVCYKMLLASSLALESIDEYPPTYHSSNMYEETLSTGEARI